MRNSEFLQSLGVVAFNEVYIFHLISTLPLLFLIRFIIMSTNNVTISTITYYCYYYTFYYCYYFCFSYHRCALFHRTRSQMPPDAPLLRACPRVASLGTGTNSPSGFPSPPSASLGVSSEPFGHKLRPSNLVKRTPSESPRPPRAARVALSPRCRRLFRAADQQMSSASKQRGGC